MENIWKNIDRRLIVLYLLLITFGWLNIYAAGYDASHPSIFDFKMAYGKQLVWIGAALLISVIIIMSDGKLFSHYSIIFYCSIIGLLIITLLIGKVVAGSKSWLEFGSISIQPAEFAKFSTALMLAAYLNILSIDMRKLKTKIISFSIIGLPAILILLQNDTGSAIVFASFFMALYREGVSGRYFIIGLIAILLFVLTLFFHKTPIIIAILAITTIYILINKKTIPIISKTLGLATLAIIFCFGVEFMFSKLNDYQQTRIEVLLGIKDDLRGAGYNVHQSMIAIGSGGLFGKGFLNGTQTKYNYVPEQTTDFIFCTVGEEWGFVGSFTVIFLFVALIVRIITKAEKQRSIFSRVYGYCVAGVFFFHLLVNIGMTIGLVPVIGIPLPFFSYGGSSLWAFTILLFIFIKLDSQRQELF